MGTGVKKLSNDLEVLLLPNWFARQGPQACRFVQFKGDEERGKLFYDARCASCHEKRKGNRLVGGPSLTRLEGW